MHLALHLPRLVRALATAQPGRRPDPASRSRCRPDTPTELRRGCRGPGCTVSDGSGDGWWPQSQRASRGRLRDAPAPRPDRRVSQPRCAPSGGCWDVTGRVRAVRGRRFPSTAPARGVIQGAGRKLVRIQSPIRRIGGAGSTEMTYIVWGLAGRRESLWNGTK